MTRTLSPSPTRHMVDEFNVELEVLNGLAAYGRGAAEQPPAVPNTSGEAESLLRSSVGRAIVASWATTFDDTIHLLNKFHDNKLDKAPSKDVRLVKASLSETVSALVGRLNDLAVH